MIQKTPITKIKQIKRQWQLVDLNGQILGRAATRISQYLIGKNKPYFQPNLDCGDYVVAINAQQVKVTGKKAKDKIYYRHSGYPGGFKQSRYEEIFSQNPKKIVTLAVRGMLPKNKLRQRRLKRLKIFINQDHPYQDKLSPKG